MSPLLVPDFRHQHSLFSTAWEQTRSRGGMARQGCRASPTPGINRRSPAFLIASDVHGLFQGVRYRFPRREPAADDIAQGGWQGRSALRQPDPAPSPPPQPARAHAYHEASDGPPVCSRHVLKPDSNLHQSAPPKHVQANHTIAPDAYRRTWLAGRSFCGAGFPVTSSSWWASRRGS